MNAIDQRERVDRTGSAFATPDPVQWKYDAFGNTIASKTTGANAFAYRFSTKPLDSETGFYYYGYRYYDPVTGRWPSRDPLGEEGGINLYAMVANSPINWIDKLGLSKRRNCKAIGKQWRTRLPTKRFGPPVGYGSVEVGARINGEMKGEECEECCSDGTWKKVKEFTWSVKARGFVRATLGPQFSAGFGSVNVSGFLGLRISGELSLNGSLSKGIEGGCGSETPSSGTLSGDASGKLKGGGRLTARAVWLEFEVAEATVNGSISRGCQISVECDSEDCQYQEFSCDGEWSGSANVRFGAFGTFYTHQLF